MKAAAVIMLLLGRIYISSLRDSSYPTLNELCWLSPILKTSGTDSNLLEEKTFKIAKLYTMVFNRAANEPSAMFSKSQRLPNKVAWNASGLRVPC